MTRQAENCINLFMGNEVSTILRGLKRLSRSVVNELVQAYHCDDLNELAYKLHLHYSPEDC